MCEGEMEDDGYTPMGLSAVAERLKAINDVMQAGAAPDVPIVTVTEEMIAAGLAADEALPPSMPNTDSAAAIYFAAIYRAMHATAPVEFCPEQWIAELQDELTQAWTEAYDEQSKVIALQAENTRLHAALKARTEERDEASEKVVEFYEQNTRINEQNWRIIKMLRVRDAEIMRLRDLLAQRPAPVPDAPKPVHDFTRAEGGDRRRVGG
jgi:hypothetical protein